MKHLEAFLLYFSTCLRHPPPTYSLGIATWQQAWQCHLELSAGRHKVMETPLVTAGDPPSVYVRQARYGVSIELSVYFFYSYHFVFVTLH